MRTCGVHGGDLEILAFCSAFRLQTVVYDVDMGCWTVYKPYGESDSSIGIIILQRENEFYVPITHLSHQPEETSVSSTCPNNNESAPKVRRTESNNVDCDLLNVNLNESDSTASCQYQILCDVCHRNETDLYPLNLKPFSPSVVRRRNVYNQLKHLEEILCHNCYCYCTEDKQSILWSSAWPAICFQHLVNPQHWNLLPSSFQSSWAFYARRNALLPSNDQCVFLDISEYIKNFEKLIGSYTSANFIKAVNTYCQPFIRCFCGGSEFFLTKLDMLNSRI